MAKATFDSPIFSLTPAERLDREAKTIQNMPIDPDIQEMKDAPMGFFMLGARNSLTGALGFQVGGMVDAFINDSGSEPLNLSKGRSEYNPTADPMSWGMDNNPEGIAQRLENIPFEHYDYVLSSGNWNEFDRRVQFIKAGLPDAQQFGSGVGTFVGAASDIAGMIAAGLAAEPLAIAGLGARTTLAGRAVQASSGMWRVQSPAQAAAEAAATISRTNLAIRNTALGIGEEVVFQGLRNGLDPVYSPEASDVVYQLAFSGGVGGLVGGAVFGRTFIRSHIEDAASEFRRLRTVDLPGGYSVTYGDRLSFGSPVAADKMLFGPSALSLADESRRVGRDLFFDWQRRADLGVADTNIPGTRTIPIGEVPIAGAPRVVRDLAEEVAPGAQRPLKPTIGVTAKPTIGVRSAIKAAAHELQLAGVELNEAVFAMLAQAIVRTNAKRVTAGAFNKEFWAEVSSNLPPEAVAKLRPVSERAFIPGIDRTVMDAVTRDDMVTEIWNHFRAGTHMDPANEKSLIFQVLQEIRNRGGMVNRKVVEDVVDRLREISQNPPKRVNAKGKTVLDANQRRLQVINLINEKTGQLKRGATGAKPIAIPNSLISRMGGTGVRNIPMGGFGEPTAPTVGGTRDFSDVPRVSALMTERIPLWSAIGNQSARAMESANGAARWIAHHVFHARRAFDKAQPTTIFESGTTLLHKSMYMFNRAYRNGLVRFAMGNGTDNVLDQPTIINSLKAFGRREMARDFHRRVAKQLRTGAYDDSVDAVNDAARGMRELFNNIHELASEVGVKGFTRSAVVNYMPRLWRFDKIRRLATTAEGRADLTNLIKASINQNGRKIVIDGVEQTIEGDLDSAAKAFAERLISIAQKTENAPLLDQEQELADALGDLLAPLKAKTPSRTPFGRARILLDENASVAATGDHFSDGMRALSIADLTNDDLPFVFRKYVTSVMGAINERRLLNAFNEELRARNIMGASRTNAAGETVQEIAEVSTIDDMMKVARKLGGEIEAGQEEGLREVIAAMRYEPIHRGSAGLGDRILGIALPYGYLTTGGQFGLAAVGEIARLVGTLGIKRVIQQMPVIAEMLSNWKNLDRPAQNMASFVDSWFAPSTDRLRRALFNPLSDGVRYGEVSTGGIIYSAVKRGLDGASNFMSDITGLAPITSMTQQLTAATTMQHLYDVAKDAAKRLDAATVRSLGLEMDQYEQLIRYVGNNAEIKNGFMGPRVVGMGNLDAREMDMLRNFVGRMVRTRIQDVPTRGDFHKMAFSFVGRLLTQFRTFNLKGIDNFLIQNAGRINRGGGAKVAQEVMATMLFAGLIQYGRNYADWASFKASGDKKRAERMEPLLGVTGFIRGATSGPAEFFLLGVGGDAIWTSTISPDPIFSPYRYSGLDWFGFPGEAMARRGYEVYKDVYGATAGKALELPAERDITRSTIHKMRLLLPGQNIPFLKQYLNLKEEDIATEWNLQQTQSRD